MHNIKTSTILLLTAATLVTVACDPYPKAPGGNLEVLRAVASGGNIEQVDGPFTDPNAIVVDDAPLDALFFVWFTKEMDGASIQAFPDIDPATAKPPLDPNLPNPAFPGPGELAFLPVENPCEVARSPLATKQVPADASICYDPGSAQGGGLMQVSPAAFWDVGAYVVGGTVRDYTGAPLQFKATFNVTHKPVLVAADAYNVDVGWANDPTATGFTIERTVTADSNPPAADAVWTNAVVSTQWFEPGSTTPANNEIYRDTARVPGTRYWYRILPEGTATPVVSNPTLVRTAAAPTPAVKANPVVGGTAAAGTVQISIGRIRGADYRVELAPVDGAGVVGTYAAATGAITTPAGAVLTNPITARSTNPLVFNVAGLTNLQAYKARIVPIFGGVDATPTNASATFTINNP